jgi:hypothetical protein
MRDTMIRLGVVAGLGLLGILSQARADPVPGSGWILGMVCINLLEGQNCGTISAREDCVGKSGGADCTFCDGDYPFRTCVTQPPKACHTTGHHACGDRVSGNCTMIDPDGPGGPIQPYLSCTGNQVIASCSMVTCDQ